MESYFKQVLPWFLNTYENECRWLTGQTTSKEMERISLKKLLLKCSLPVVYLF